MLDVEAQGRPGLQDRGRAADDLGMVSRYFLPAVALLAGLVLLASSLALLGVILAPPPSGCACVGVEALPETHRMVLVGG